jgi:glycosyltransferase involved in cell wall biosynthesis
MAAHLGERLKNPIHCIVWDHPDHVIRSYGHKSWTLSALRGCFNKVVRRADSTISVADALRDWLTTVAPYTKHGVVKSPIVSLAALRLLKSDETFVIGFAGSVTAPNELEGFQRALDRVGWRIGGRRVILRLFGSRFNVSATSPRNVEYSGYLSTSQHVVEELSKCDACFLPQPFSEEAALVARYSFPTKFSAYMAAGRPIIVHSPACGSIPVFLRGGTDRSGPCIGAVSTDPDSSSLIPLLHQLISSASQYEQAVEKVCEMRVRHFSREACSAELQRLIP